jgi:hypothetical protein
MYKLCLLTIANVVYANESKGASGATPSVSEKSIELVGEKYSSMELLQTCPSPNVLPTMLEQVCSCQDAPKHWVHKKQKTKIKNGKSYSILLNLLRRNRDKKLLSTK